MTNREPSRIPTPEMIEAGLKARRWTGTVTRRELAEIYLAMEAARDPTPKRDNCAVCKGANGGVRGNENVIEGVTVCDYCHAAIMPILASLKDNQPTPSEDVVERLLEHLSEMTVRSRTTSISDNEIRLIRDRLASLKEPTKDRETDREALLRIADDLIDQRAEPWPTISPEKRTHYWRDKAIDAAKRLKRIAEGMRHG